MYEAEESHTRKLLQEEEDPVDGYESGLWSDHQSGSEHNTISEEVADPEDNNSQPENDDYCVGVQYFSDTDMSFNLFRYIIIINKYDLGCRKPRQNIGVIIQQETNAELMSKSLMS